MIVAESGSGPANGQPAFTPNDLDWIESRLRGVRLPPPPKRTLERPRQAALPLPAPSTEPVDPLKEIGQYFLEHNRALLRYGHASCDKFTFWRDHILFLPWRWGADFPLSVAREAAVELLHELIEHKLEAGFVQDREAAVVRGAARDSTADAPAQPPTPYKPVGNEIDDEAVLVEGERLLAAKAVKSEYAAAKLLLPKAGRQSKETTDKAVIQRVTGKLKARRRGTV